MNSLDPCLIAVVGLSCRFPGGANDPEKLWSLVSEGRSAWRDVPADRFNWKSHYHPSPEVNGTTNHRGGHFLDQDTAAFDAAFFGVPPLEAQAIDPQQRIQLETAYEALENAGVPIEQVRGSQTSVYIATFSKDYDRMMFKDTCDFAQYHMIGSGNAIFSNRISYLFDLKGPSMTIDTGCSGSLVALHQACHSLRAGESTMALVGGTNLILSPDAMISMSLLRILNADGKCYTFDDRGSGYGRGEGVATIVLKRLDHALQAGDNIRAIVRETGVNQDGKTLGITLPSQDAQESLIRSVYSRARIDPREVGYVEAHGTGTVAGDSAEFKSIMNSFGTGRNMPLYVGSIKSNIGHLESASGLAGLINAILVLEKACIPPIANLESLKKELSFEDKYCRLPRRKESWPDYSGQPRYASVNSFGYGGTNAHVILQAAPPPIDPTISTEVPFPNINASSTSFDSHGINGHGIHANEKRGFAVPLKVSQNLDLGCGEDVAPKAEVAQLLVMTAKSELSLLNMGKDLALWANNRTSKPNDLCGLAYTLSSRRSLMEWRYSVVASNRQDLASRLSSDALKSTKASTNNSIVFLFTGQGAQWHAMGRELIHTQAVFRTSLAKSEQILGRLGAPWSLIEELLSDQRLSRLDDSVIAQPATTALQIALVDLLSHFGIRPNIVLGHSSGEIAAAYAADVLTQAAALSVSFHRGLITASLTSRGGAMLAVGLGEDDTLGYISQVKKESVALACVNSPASTTVSGDASALKELQVLLNNCSVFNRELKVNIAYHSHHMQDIAGAYLKALHGLDYKTTSSAVQFISSVTGFEKIADFGPSYWVQNLVSKVRYSDAIRTLNQIQKSNGLGSTNMHLLIEVGPHSVLKGPTSQTIKYLNNVLFQYQYFPSLVRVQNSIHTVMQLAGKLFEFGYPVDLMAVNTLDGSRQPLKVVSDLPPYPWDHSTKYWYESRLSRDDRLRQHPYHDLLGVRMVGGGFRDRTWRHIINLQNLPWLRDHVINGSVVYPGAGYICMAIEAVRQVFQDRRTVGAIRQFKIRDLVFSKPLIIPEPPAKIEAQLTLLPRHGEASSESLVCEEFSVSSLPRDGVLTEHCRGIIMVELESPADSFQILHEEYLTAVTKQQGYREMSERCTHKIGSVDFYKELQSSGNTYGSLFAVLQDVRMCEVETTAKIVIPHVAASMPFEYMQPHLIHPATLDALFQITIPLFLRQTSLGCVMPASVTEIVISADLSSKVGDEIIVGANIALEGRRNAMTDVLAFQMGRDSEMKPMITVSQAELFATGDSHGSGADSKFGENMTFQMEWGPDVDFLSVNGEKDSTSQSLAKTTCLSPEEKLENLNKAATLYIQLCLLGLGGNDRAVTENHLMYMLRWMRRHAVSESSQKIIANMSAAEIRDTMRDIEMPGAEGEVLSRIGENLLSVLTGKLDPLSLLLEKNLLNRFYLEDDSSKQCCGHLLDYLRQLFFKKPGLTVLEIGAGTGGTTKPLLQSLCKDHQFIRRYDFTDISSGFFGSAQSQLAEWSDFLRFKTLDVERNPTDQGFEEGSYDLVIACNVLHATEKMDVTVSNVQKLLKAGGKLALIEVTRTVPWINVFAGVLPGWWRGFEDGRTESPILSIEQWDTVLRKNSFTGIDFQAPDFYSSASKANMMISTKTKDNSRLIQGTIEIVDVQTSEKPFSNISSHLLSAVTKKGLRCKRTSLPLIQISESAIYVVLDSKETPILLETDPERFKEITTVSTQGQRILWVTLCEDHFSERHPAGNLMAGMARVARSENESLRFVTLDVRQNLGSDNSALIEAIAGILLASFGVEAEADSVEYEYAYQNDRVLIPRLIPSPQIHSSIDKTPAGPQYAVNLFHQPDRPLKLQVQQPGLLDSLVFVDDESALVALSPDEIEVEVEACGINFKDVFVALGRMKNTTKMTGECSGVVTAVGSSLQARYRVGDRVCGWNGTPYASNARMKGNDTSKLPETISFSTGASIPVNFMTAHYSLIEIADLQKDQTVLIHAASGGVGQAAIMLAQHVEAEIFATAGSDVKRRLIMDQYQIPETHVFSSQSRSFKDGIMRLTHGRGIDVILNSSSGVVLQDTWHCVAECGTFIELGKTDIYQKGQIDMEPFDRNVSFASVDLVTVAKRRPKKLQEVFATVMSLFEQGALKAVQPVTTMPISDIEQAFRLIQGRKHQGKVVLEAGKDVQVKAVAAKPEPLRLDNRGTYVVAGGFGDVGQGICRMMADAGAKHILILSRRKVSAEELRPIEVDLAGHGARLHTEACDISDERSVQEVASRCRANLPPIKGVVQAAVVLQDRVLEQMTQSDFRAGILPKYHGTYHLSEAYESPSLDFFIMLASLSGILGVKSQAAYAAGSVSQDALAHSKASSHTHYISIDLGMIEDSETVSSHPERRSSLLRAGFVPMKLKQALDLIAYCMSAQARKDRPRQIVTGFNRHSLISNNCTVNLRNPLFNHLPVETFSGENGPKAQKARSVDAAVAAATSLDEVHIIIGDAIKTQLATLVALDVEKLTPELSMGALGLDSLIMIELRNWIGRTLQASVSTAEITDVRDLKGLVGVVVERSGLVKGRREGCGRGSADDGIGNGDS